MNLGPWSRYTDETLDQFSEQSWSLAWSRACGRALTRTWSAAQGFNDLSVRVVLSMSRSPQDQTAVGNGGLKREEMSCL